MKPESLLILILMIPVITLAVGGIIGNMSTYYDTNVSKEWENQYNFQNEINDSISEVKTKVEEVGEAKGYLTIVTGVSAIFSGIKTTATMLLKVPTYATTTLRGVASGLSLGDVISSSIIPIFIIMIIMLVVFMGIRLARGDAI